MCCTAIVTPLRHHVNGEDNLLQTDIRSGNQHLTRFGSDPRYWREMDLLLYSSMLDSRCSPSLVVGHDLQQV